MNSKVCDPTFRSKSVNNYATEEVPGFYKHLVTRKSLTSNNNKPTFFRCSSVRSVLLIPSVSLLLYFPTEYNSIKSSPSPVICMKSPSVPESDLSLSSSNLEFRLQ